MSMAHLTVRRVSKEFDIFKSALKPIAVKTRHIQTGNRFERHKKDGREKDKEGANWGSAGVFGLSASVATIGLYSAFSKRNVLAEEDETKKEIIHQENR